jgi:Cu/Ag efflux protein CusF
MNARNAMLAVALIATATVTAGAQSVQTTSQVLKATATIKQIDSTSRIVTFVKDDGAEDTLWIGPDVKRFSELKVGDKVTMTYYESLVMGVRKPGDPPLVPKTSAAAVTGAGGPLPGGTAAAQHMMTVTVKALDTTAGTITVTTEGGRTISRKVDDKARLNGVKVGDRIDIVYTEALLASVERPK